MSNAQGNLKRLSKYGQGGKAFFEALLVRIIWKLIMIVFSFDVCLSVQDGCIECGWVWVYMMHKQRRAKSPSLTKFVAISQEKREKHKQGEEEKERNST